MTEGNRDDNGIFQVQAGGGGLQVAPRMKVSIQVLGSLGDVMPYIPVAKALEARGADVSILAPVDYGPVIAAAGLKADRTPGFVLTEWMNEAARRGTMSNPVAFFRDWNAMITPFVDDTMACSLEAAEGADIVVANLICAPARIAAEACRTAFLLTAQQPVLSPTRQHPCAMIWRPWMGTRLNRASYAMVWLAQRLIGVPLARHRRRLGVRDAPALSDMRRHLGQPLRKVTTVPRALMPAAPADWSAHDILAPYPSLASGEAAALPSALEQFLSGGAPPVYIGLGSLSDARGHTVMDAALEALDALGLRGIFPASLAAGKMLEARGHFVTGHVPHDLLFPRCAAALHHGGAGTTDSALHAGVPQVVQPHMLDQFWFAAALQGIGIAGRALPARGLVAGDVIRALEAARAPASVAAARRAQAAMSGNNGASDLAGIILDEAQRFRANAGSPASHR